MNIRIVGKSVRGAHNVGTEAQLWVAAALAIKYSCSGQFFSPAPNILHLRSRRKKNEDNGRHRFDRQYHVSALVVQRECRA